MVTKDRASQQEKARRATRPGAMAPTTAKAKRSGANKVVQTEKDANGARGPRPKVRAERESGAKAKSARQDPMTSKPRTTAKQGGIAKAASRNGRIKALSPDEIAELFRRFEEIEPEPKGELEHSNPYTLLVAVVLSAQATDAGVNKATRGLFKLADTPAKMVALGEERVREAIRTIGLYRNKAKNVIALSKQLLAEHAGEVPRNRDLLETLPGVGRKTANVVMNVAFGQPTMAVDTHVFRLANRIGLSNGTTPLAVEKDLLERIPAAYGVPAHHWLILHGRYLCKARKPECYRCPIRDICRFEPKTPHA